MDRKELPCNGDRPASTAFSPFPARVCYSDPVFTDRSPARKITPMETLLCLAIGIGLSAACGFRIFVPMLGMSLAALSGHLTLSTGFEWIGTWPALMTFGTAAVLEIGAYYCPFLDNLLDAVATPAAIVAGTILTAAMVRDMSPLLRWSLAIIAGGGVAGLIQGGTAAMRAGSSGATGGFANPVLSTLEIGGSIASTALAILLPLAGLLLVVWICVKMIRILARSSFFVRSREPRG